MNEISYVVAECDNKVEWHEVNYFCFHLVPVSISDSNKVKEKIICAKNNDLKFEIIATYINIL